MTEAKNEDARILKLIGFMCLAGAGVSLGIGKILEQSVVINTILGAFFALFMLLATIAGAGLFYEYFIKGQEE